MRTTARARARATARVTAGPAAGAAARISAEAAAVPARRAALAALCGALLLVCALVPSARADGHALTPPEILGVTVNGGRPLVLGPGQSLTFQATVTARADVGIHRRGVEISLFGPDGQRLDGLSEPAPGCAPTSATTAVCTEWFRVDTGSAEVTNDWAGDWRVWALVASSTIDEDPDHSITTRSFPDAFMMQRRARLTFVASPNPVAAGRDVGMLGRLTVADWETDAYAGRSGQPVTLESCAVPCRTVESVRSLTTGASGITGTSLPVTRDGSWWLRYRGTGLFSATLSPGVLVDVR
ncbi:hypothetical protein [Streptomyces heilongjiangensis]|uniref:Calcium-binding protein n=1 Tax=Streptomyces heilongjiangensis TaxID=945052 RepID=A0ABW1B5W2_9ACTN|nr:hypothetical protein [Streptomyces heilongjiangensis]MDC2951403.1 hypothetical protein [Streptomyces heilongjiangensis]